LLHRPSREALQNTLVDTEYLISERVGLIDAELIAAAPHLKLILRLGSLTHDIDLDAARSAGVIVCRWPDAGAIRVAEHTIMFMLALAKQLNEAQSVARAARSDGREVRRTDENTFAYNWSGRQGIGQLYERVIGILGFGEIGAELAQRLESWGCTLLYHKRRQLPAAFEIDFSLTYADRNTLITQADYLVNLLPYTAETALNLGAETFAQMKPGAFLVSCGSGGIVDETALANALRAGHLGGAALDTYAWEPLQADNPLVVLANAGHNLILTPHIAAGSYTAQSSAEERRAIYTNILRHLRGEPLVYRLA
ncbi:MAG: hypothetical protein KC547_22015, partial [Anaerolineae bacterium]|nr:hypothetical protein [Anaerolineae bacterium]